MNRMENPQLAFRELLKTECISAQGRRRQELRKENEARRKEAIQKLRADLSELHF